MSCNQPIFPALSGEFKLRNLDTILFLFQSPAQLFPARLGIGTSSRNFPATLTMLGQYVCKNQGDFQAESLELHSADAAYHHSNTSYGPHL